MAQVAVAELLYLLDQAFGDHEAHALLANLRDLEPEEWEWAPPDGQRSCRAIVAHVGWAKYMYENYAFGDASMRGDDPFLLTPERPETPPADVLAWLAEGHARFRRSVATLTDDDLPRPRKANWGEEYETRWLIATIIQHDTYHAGEINHLRALRRGADRWAYEL